MAFESIVKRVNLSKLSRREKIVVVGGGCVLVLFLLIQFVIAPMFHRRTQLRQAVTVKTLMLAEMQRMKAEYEGLKLRSKQSEARFMRRDKGFTLFPFWISWPASRGSKNA